MPGVVVDVGTHERDLIKSQGAVNSYNVILNARCDLTIEDMDGEMQLIKNMIIQ